jgi:hypothetical protein
MRNFLLLILALSVSFSLIAQQRPSNAKSLRNVAVKAEYQKAVKDVLPDAGFPVNPGLKSTVAINEETIGVTRYDLQSNAAVANRFYRYDDGRMNFVWTRGMLETSFSDRGTGYNSNDGTAWGPAPTARIESIRTGWPSYAPAGATGEIVTTHYADAMHVSKRSTWGSGAWTETNLMGPSEAPALSWPRVAASGTDNNVVHVVANSYDPYMGQNSALLYWQSNDGGETWDVQNEILAGTGSDYYLEISADRYSWATKGDVVALLVYSSWHDMFMLKSNDNGQNWTKTVIWEHPYPFFDFEVTLTDTFYCVDNSAAITLDNNGMAHVTFAISRVLHDATGTTYSYFPGVDGIGYWNETRPTFSNNLHALDPYGHPESELEDNVSLIGWTQDVNGNGTLDLVGDIMSYRSIGLSTMPTIYVDELGLIFVAWSSTTETFDNGSTNYKHVWMRGSSDEGNSWGDFKDLMAGIFHVFDEGILPQLANSSDENIYLAYNIDNEPGLALDSDHGYVDNSQVVATISKDELIFNIGIDKNDKASFSVSQNYPNPASEVTKIEVTLNQASNLRVEVANMLGQKVMEVNNGKVAAGSHIISLNVNGLEKGVYMYTVYTNTGKVTNKMTIE